MQVRAKHDIYNGLAAGCFTGAAISYKSAFLLLTSETRTDREAGGAQGMAAGCVGMAAFSLVIDQAMKFISTP